MKVHEKLFDFAREEATHKTIETVTAGLKYTAVSLKEGGLGVAYTYSQGHCCGGPGGEAFFDYEGQNAAVLLDKIREDGPVGRSMALALLNALNGRRALAMAEDPDNAALYRTLDARQGRRLAMVGYFKPVARVLTDRGVELYITDRSHNMGSQEELYGKLQGWAEGLILTSTTIVNGSFDEIVAQCPKGLPIAMLGPTTPMIPEVFSDYGIALLAGTAPDKVDLTMRLIRQGAGTPEFQRYAKKVFFVL